MKHPKFEASGYPTVNTLETIMNWPHEDWRGLVQYVIEAWNKKDGCYVFANNTLELFTGEHYGNKDIIDALEANNLFWMQYWDSTHRGGKYVFKFLW